MARFRDMRLLKQGQSEPKVPPLMRAEAGSLDFIYTNKAYR